jgi:excisionase family DNA binding protein
MRLDDAEVVELFERAEELGLLPAAVEPDPWLDIKEACEYSGYAASTIRNALTDGRLPRRHERGHRVRVLRSDLDALIEGRQAA